MVMTRTDSIAILKILKANYSNFYKNLSKEDAEDIIKLWMMMFEEPLPLILESVKAVMTTNKFPPSVADVKDKIAIIIAKDESKRTEVEAWSQVYKAVEKSNYYATECFEKFDDNLKRLVGSPNQLREWAKMQTDELTTVVQSHFVRSYRAMMTKQEEFARLPESTKKFIESEKNLQLDNNMKNITSQIGKEF